MSCHKPEDSNDMLLPRGYSGGIAELEVRNWQFLVVQVSLVRRNQSLPDLCLVMTGYTSSTRKERDNLSMASYEEGTSTLLQLGRDCPPATCLIANRDPWDQSAFHLRYWTWQMNDRGNAVTFCNCRSAIRTIVQPCPRSVVRLDCSQLRLLRLAT